MRAQLESLVKELVAKGVYYEDARKEFERHYIEHALHKAAGSISGAATLMGVHRNTLTRKMAEYKVRAHGR